MISCALGESVDCVSIGEGQEGGQSAAFYILSILSSEIPWQPSDERVGLDADEE